MRSSFFVTLIVMSVFFGLTVPAKVLACFEGNFNAKGWNVGVAPEGKESYNGTLSVTKAGEQYKLEWKIGPDAFMGVGVCDATSQTLYVSYANLKSGWFGIVFYDKNMKGKWSVAGDTSGKWGAEVLTKI